MDDFVRTAFEDAREALAAEEYSAYDRCFIKDDRGDVINMTAVLQTGVDRMERMLASIGAENRQTMADYIAHLVISVFHQGYTARMEDEK